MLIPLILFDVRPPVGTGLALAVILFVIAFVILFVGLAALIFFLWYRKRKMSVVEMVRPKTQPNNPSQP